MIFDVSFSCASPVIDHEFRHNFVKVDPQATLKML